MTSTTHSPTSGSGIRDLAFDVALPVALYVLLHSMLGVALVTALAISSIPPAARTVARLVRREPVDALALLMLGLNVAGIATSFATGNARFTFAKDSVISSVAAISILVGATRGRYLMSAGLKPFVTRGATERVLAWERLATGSDRFRRCERRYSLVWGACLLADCVARLVGAVTLPVHTMSWASTAILAAAVIIASVASGPVAAEPIKGMVDAETPSAAAGRARVPFPAESGA